MTSRDSASNLGQPEKPKFSSIMEIQNSIGLSPVSERLIGTDNFDKQHTGLRLSDQFGMAKGPKLDPYVSFPNVPPSYSFSNSLIPNPSSTLTFSTQSFPSTHRNDISLDNGENCDQPLENKSMITESQSLPTTSRPFDALLRKSGIELPKSDFKMFPGILNSSTLAPNKVEVSEVSHVFKPADLFAVPQFEKIGSNSYISGNQVTLPSPLGEVRSWNAVVGNDMKNSPWNSLVQPTSIWSSPKVDEQIAEQLREAPGFMPALPGNASGINDAEEPSKAPVVVQRVQVSTIPGFPTLSEGEDDNRRISTSASSTETLTLGESVTDNSSASQNNTSENTDQVITSEKQNSGQEGSVFEPTVKANIENDELRDSQAEHLNNDIFGGTESSVEDPASAEQTDSIMEEFIPVQIEEMIEQVQEKSDQKLQDSSKMVEDPNKNDIIEEIPMSKEQVRQSNRPRKPKGHGTASPVHFMDETSMSNEVNYLKRTYSPEQKDEKKSKSRSQSPARAMSPVPSHSMRSQSPLRIVVPNDPGLSHQNSSSSSPVPQISFPKNPLIEAIQSGNILQLRALLNAPQIITQINAQDEKGLCAILYAAALPSPSISFQCVQLLLAFGALSRVRDKLGFTPAHWAAAMDNVESLRAILANAPDLLEAPCTKQGDTPLHRSARFGTVKSAHTLIEFGANPLTLNFDFETTLEVAGKFPNGDWKTVSKNRSLIRPVLFECAPYSRTLVLYHHDCLLHETIEGHQEAPDRIHSILRELDRSEGVCGLVVSEDFAHAPLESVLRAHDQDYVQFVIELDAQLRAENATKPVAFTPRVQRAVTSAQKFKPESSCDTYFSKGSLVASLRAAGAVMRAIDFVLNGVTRNAFCAVRPPGHHAGTKGLLDDATSCGFCIF